MNKEIIPKLKLCLMFHNPIKEELNIQLVEHENMFIVESLYSYVRFDNLQEATQEFNLWVEDEKRF
jgi:hypothetical protein